MDQGVDLSNYQNRFRLGHKLARLAWNMVWLCLFRPSPRPLVAWRRFLLSCFGARLGRGANVFPSTRIWAPWNLFMGAQSCLSFQVDCYNVARITLGDHATVSQYAYLCSASHDISHPHMELTFAPITIEAQAWVAADAFIAPGVTVGEGAVVGARASVFKNVPAWTVVGGNPAKKIKDRVIKNSK
jgi:putative colanic acid biosynthesis acetyltransferase WcaF